MRIRNGILVLMSVVLMGLMSGSGFAESTFVPLGSRSLIIGSAYDQALGRVATNEEFAFWLLVSDGDPRIASAEVLASYLRQEDALIRSGPVEMPENSGYFTVMSSIGGDAMSKVIGYSYYEGLGRLPTKEEYASWSSTPRHPAELHGAIQGALTEWIKNSLITRLTTIRSAYKLALGREPVINEYINQNRTLKASGIGFAGLAFSLSQSNGGRVLSFAYPVGNQILAEVNSSSRPVPPEISGNPTPPPTNDDGRAVVVALPQNISTEHCFGAVGNQCDGVTFPSHAPVTKRGNVPYTTYTAWVSVGSIMHDVCCRKHPDGQMCHGYDVGEEISKANYYCASEWRKAAYNQRDARNWQAKFGPYPAGNSSDDLTDIQARKGALFDRLGNFESWWNSYETPATRRLAAPKRTALDITDEAFCESGKFDVRYSEIPLPIPTPVPGIPVFIGKIGAWGVCK